MLKVLGLWETGWMECERTERRLWKQTIQAYAVDFWGMSDVRGGPFTSPIQYASLAEMLAAHPGPKTFLIPPTSYEGGTSLASYTHPEDATYVFGSSPENLVSYVTEQDTVVSICTPVESVLFAAGALCAVMHDRCAKSQ